MVANNIITIDTNLSTQSRDSLLWTLRFRLLSQGLQPQESETLGVSLRLW